MATTNWTGPRRPWPRCGSTGRRYRAACAPSHRHAITKGEQGGGRGVKECISVPQTVHPRTNWDLARYRSGTSPDRRCHRTGGLWSRRNTRSCAYSPWSRRLLAPSSMWATIATDLVTGQRNRFARAPTPSCVRFRHVGSGWMLMLCGCVCVCVFVSWVQRRVSPPHLSFKGVCATSCLFRCDLVSCANPPPPLRRPLRRANLVRCIPAHARGARGRDRARGQDCDRQVPPVPPSNCERKSRREHCLFLAATLTSLRHCPGAGEIVHSRGWVPSRLKKKVGWGRTNARPDPRLIRREEKYGTHKLRGINAPPLPLLVMRRRRRERIQSQRRRRPRRHRRCHRPTPSTTTTTLRLCFSVV